VSPIVSKFHQDQLSRINSSIYIADLNSALAFEVGEVSVLAIDDNEESNCLTYLFYSSWILISNSGITNKIFKAVILIVIHFFQMFNVAHWLYLPKMWQSKILE
jgi:hypothetical protein